MSVQRPSNAHPRRDEIDAAILRGLSNRAAAKAIRGVTLNMVAGRRWRLLGPSAEAEERHALVRIASLRTRAEELIAKAEELEARLSRKAARTR